MYCVRIPTWSPQGPAQQLMNSMRFFSLAFKGLLEEALKDLQLWQLCMSNVATARGSNFSVSGYDLGFIQGGEEAIVIIKSEPGTASHMSCAIVRGLANKGIQKWMVGKILSLHFTFSVKALSKMFQR